MVRDVHGIMGKGLPPAPRTECTVSDMDDCPRKVCIEERSFFFPSEKPDSLSRCPFPSRFIRRPSFELK